jgi:outer membrane receptor protein involved in Fe transport
LKNSQELLKNYIGLSLESKLLNKKLTNIISAKHFYGKFNVAIIDDDLTNKGYNNESFDDFGYGNALKYQILPKLSATLNYEYTMRMPDRQELFGDFISTFPNSDLIPERSHNLDLGLRFNMAKKLTAEVNMFYRQTSDMIFLNVLNIYKTIYINLLSTDIKGIEGEIRYNPTQTVSLYANATWQDIRLKGIDDNSKIDPRYIGSRLPNEPRIFGNAGASHTLPFNLFKHDKIQVYYTLNYVQEFYLTWEEEGLEATKDRTPTQAVHNGGILYSLDDDKWSLSLESRNFTNEKVYDNFSVQKPGRSFHLKLRMFLE